MKNILIINPMLYTAPPKGGAVPRHKSINDCMIVALCRGFIKLGCNVTLVASEEYRPTAEECFDFKIVYFKNTVKRIIPRFPNGLPILSGLKKWLKREGSEYDLVICSELFAFSTISAARICPSKVIVWQEIGAHHPMLFKIPSILWHNTVVKWFVTRQSIPIVPRSSSAAEFASKYCNNITHVINNCVDGDQFVSCKNKYDRLICIAQLIKRKNVGYVIEQFIKYKCKYCDNITELYIVGDGEMRAELMDMASDDPSVVFKGALPHSELSSILSHSKGFLLSSKHDLNCVSITESVVAGVPVLTNRKSYQSDFIVENNLGIAKDDWNEDDIKLFLDNLQHFAANCNVQRDKLTNYGVASQFLSL